MPIQVELSTIERHNVDRVGAIYPKGHSKYPEGRSVTIREEINEAIAQHGYWLGRKDVAYLYFTGEDRDNIWIDPTSTGEPEWNGALPFLTKADLATIRDLNRLVIETERREGWKPGTLTNRR